MLVHDFRHVWLVGVVVWFGWHSLDHVGSGWLTAGTMQEISRGVTYKAAGNTIWDGTIALAATIISDSKHVGTIGKHAGAYPYEYLRVPDITSRQRSSRHEC